MAITLLEAIRSAAPAAAESSLVAQHMSGERTKGWRLRLANAKLDFAPPTSIEAGPPLPFEVIAGARSQSLSHEIAMGTRVVRTPSGSAMLRCVDSTGGTRRRSWASP
jgi:hypothetical protein